jgi:DNA-binding MarR family transcriptional regulator
LATTNFFRDVLARVGLTPNRYDVLLYLRHHATTPITQRKLRMVFGVARATISETLRSLVRLGLVERRRALDGRTYAVTLSERGCAVFDHARRMTQSLVKRMLAKIFRSRDSMALHDDIGEHLCIRHVFGDTADRELVWLWHPDD